MAWPLKELKYIRKTYKNLPSVFYNTLSETYPLEFIEMEKMITETKTPFQIQQIIDKEECARKEDRIKKEKQTL